MAKYTHFWKELLEKFKSEFKASDEHAQSTFSSDLAKIGNRGSSGYAGFLEVFATSIWKNTDSQVFRDLKAVLEKDRDFLNSLTGQLEIRVLPDNQIQFSYQPFSWELMINHYRDYQNKFHMKDELFKWERVQSMNDLWLKYKSEEINFEEFASKINWSKFAYQNFVGVWNAVLKEFPGELEREVLQFVEGKDSLQERVIRFRDHMIHFHSNLSDYKLKNHAQEERAYSTLLTYCNPDKYTFYINKIYEPLTKCLGIQMESTWHKLVHYYDIISELRDIELPKYNTLLSERNSLIEDPKYYDDPANQIITQDIIWVTFQKSFAKNDSKSESDESVYQKVVNKLDPEDFDNTIKTIRRLVKHFKIKPDQENVAFTVDPAKTSLRFIVNNRLVFGIHGRKKDKGFLAMGSKAFSGVVKTEEFHGVNEADSPVLNYALDKEALTNNFQEILKCTKQELEKGHLSPRREKSNDEFIEDIFKEIKMEKSKSPLNQILFGPPGTGKTYNTIDIAVDIIDNKLGSHEENKKRYDDLVASGQIRFVTFHQSMTYEDFVEGIKPNSIEGEVNYEIEAGIFKKISSTAKASTKKAINFDSAYNRLLEEIKKSGGKLVLETLVRTREFTIYENSMGNLKFHANTEKAYEAVIKKDVIEHYLKTGEALDWSSYTKAVAEKLIKDYGYSEKQEGESKNYVLIIDEVNRGNVSQIFGELITLLEEDKREGESNSISVQMPYSKELFTVPSNLYILGTMNTADRSVEALDTALRRRFSFVEMPPKPELLSPGMCFVRLLWKYKDVREWEDPKYLIPENHYFDLTEPSKGIKDKRYKLWEKMEEEGRNDEKQSKEFPDKEFSGLNLKILLQTINRRIEKLLDKDHMIGHSYFMDVVSKEDLLIAFKDKIIPLLQEYFFGDFGKIGLVLGKSFISSDKREFIGFGDFDYEDSSLVEDFKTRIVYSISSPEEWDFKSITQSPKE